MTRAFDKVVTRPPSKDFTGCVSPYPEKESVSFSTAIAQYGGLMKVLREENIDVIEMAPLQSFPDSVFIQDAAVIGRKSNKALLSRFGNVSRRGEEESLRDVLKGEGLQIDRIGEPGTLEGGDVLVTDKNLVFIGKSERTNQSGIDQIKKHFPSVECVVVPVDKFIHMPAGVRYIEDGKFIASPNAVDLKYFDKYELIEISEDLSPDRSKELYRAYLMYLGNGKIVLPPGNPKTKLQLENEGFGCVEIDFSEYWKCNGSYMCLIQPFYNYL